VSWGLIWKFEHDWQAALAKHFGNVEAERRVALTLSSVCEDLGRRASVEAHCSWYDYIRLMRSAAVGAAALGAAWLGLIAGAGRLARRKRRLLLNIFRPGLYLTSAFLICLIAAHAALAVVAIYLGESVLVGRVHIGIILAIGLGALLGVLRLANASFSIVKTATATVTGKPVSAQESPPLWNFVADVAKAVKTQPPDNLVVGLDCNFFVTEAPVRALQRTKGGWEAVGYGPRNLEGRTMFLSLPLSRILTQEELRGVLGHELAHYQGEDTAFSRKFYPIYRGTHDAIEALRESGGEEWGNLALIPGVAILSFFLEAFAAAENTISRERELVADKAGAKLVGQQSMGAALVKVHAFSPYLELIRGEMPKLLQQGKALTNSSLLFAQMAQKAATLEALAGLDERRINHPFDSHPPLAVRLDSLGVALQELRAAALQVGPGNAGIQLLAECETIEQELTEVEHYLFAAALAKAAAGSDQGQK
jgi:Zn-dependent protease with chaperone function